MKIKYQKKNINEEPTNEKDIITDKVHNKNIIPFILKKSISFYDCIQCGQNKYFCICFEWNE